MSGRLVEGMFTPNDVSPPICLGHLNHSVSPIARRTRSASRQRTTSSERVGQTNLRWHSASGKCTRSPVEVTSSDDEHSHDPEYSAIKRSNREPQLLQMVLSKPTASNHSSSSCLISGYSTPPGESMHIVGETETPVNQDTLPNTVLPGNKKQKTNPIEAFKGNNDSSNNVSIQTNQGPSRKVYAYFKRLPKKTGYKERNIVLSKTKALEYAQSCHTVVQEESFEQRNIVPSKLKGNLEYAQSCHNKMAEVMSVYNKYLEEENAAEAKELEKTTSLSQMQSLLDENREAIAELEQKLGHLRLKEQKIEKDMEQEQLELERAKEVRRGSGKVRYDYEQLFCRFMGEMQQMHNA